MAYNYSRAYLRANGELVQKIVQVAKDGDFARATFDKPEDAAQYRFKVSNLLASLALHQPDLAWVRKDVRTWIKIDQLGRWEVNVGVPPIGMALRGPKPQPVAASSLLRVKQSEELPRVFEVGETITSENFPTIWMKVMAATAREQTEFIRFKTNPGPEATAWIAQKLDERGFTITESTDVLVLKRERFVPLDASATPP